MYIIHIIHIYNIYIWESIYKNTFFDDTGCISSEKKAMIIRNAFKHDKKDVKAASVVS